MSICKVMILLLRALFKEKEDLVLENLALRQQLAVQQQTIKTPKSRPYFLDLVISTLATVEI